MLSQNKHVKVIDFGDAKYIDDAKNEQFRVDPESDDSDDGHHSMIQLRPADDDSDN